MDHTFEDTSWDTDFEEHDANEELIDSLADDFEDDFDYQPDTYTEYQDLFGGDDWDHGQFDEF
jgi:hypothetical protein